MSINKIQTPSSWLSNSKSKESGIFSAKKSPIFTEKKSERRLKGSPINEVNMFSIQRQSSDTVESSYLRKDPLNPVKKIKSSGLDGQELGPLGQRARNGGRHQLEFSFKKRNTGLRGSRGFSSGIEDVARAERMEPRPEFLKSAYTPITRRSDNKVKKIGVNKPNLSLANCSAELSETVTENLNSRIMLIITVLCTISSIFYLFVIRLELARSFMLVVLEGLILRLYYSLFWNFSQFPIDLISIFSIGRNQILKFGGLFVMSFYSYHILLNVDFSKYRNSGNFERFFCDLFAYISGGFLIYRIALAKENKIPKKMKSVSLLRATSQLIKRYLRDTIAYDLLLFVSIYCLAILTSFALLTYKNKIDSSYYPHEPMYNEQLKPSVLLKSEILLNSLFSFMLIFPLTLIKIQLTKELLCMEISDITYNGQNRIPLCFSLLRLKVLQNKFLSLDSLVEFHAVSVIENNRDMLEFLIRKQTNGPNMNNFDYDSYQSCWIQVLLYCQKTFEGMAKSLDYDLHRAVNKLTRKDEELGDYLKSFYEMFTGASPERRLALRNYPMIVKVKDCVNSIILVLNEGKRQNNLAALNEGNHFRAMREEYGRLSHKLKDLDEYLYELESRKILGNFSTSESVCKDFRVLCSFVQQKMCWIDNMTSGN